MQIEKHPIWKNVSPIKKPFHLVRLFAAKSLVNFFSPSMFIGVTGSVGKTTTTICCTHVLDQKFRTLSSTASTVVNLDPIFNIPITLLKIRPKVNKVILEMGVEYPDEMDFYLSIVAPATAIVTNVSYSHSQYLGTIEQIFQEKSKIVQQLPANGTAILNWDDDSVRKMADLTSAKIIFYGTDGKNCHIWASNIKVSNYQTSFEINYGVERVAVNLRLVGRHQVYPALAAAALGVINGISLIAIKKGLEEVEPTEHRLSLLEGLNDTVILDDTYNNSSPIGIEAALDVLNDLPAKRRILIYGEMKELGTYSPSMHRRVGQKIYKNKVDLVLLGSGDTHFIEEELKALGFASEKIEVNLSNPQIVTRILRIAHMGDLILVKGSRSGRFDEVVKRISKQK